MEVSGVLHTTAALYQGKRALGTHWTRGWVDPRASLDAVERTFCCRWQLTPKTRLTH
jgi:hypothetical protein